MTANDLAALLHISLEQLRRLVGRSADAPAHLRSASELIRATFVEANSTRLPHSASVYQSSHAGRLVHADIAGPFKRSWVGGYHYATIFCDDHTRYKAVYFIREAPRMLYSQLERFGE